MHVSKLPLLWECPSSALPCEHPYDVPSDAAGLGQAVHDTAGSMVLDQVPDFAGVAKRYACGERDLRALHWFATQAWAEIGGYFPTPKVEEPLAADGLRGRADILQLDDERCAVLDWKTSRQRSNVRPQLMGYATCAAESYGIPSSGCIQVFTVWLRLGEIDCATMRQADIDGFCEDLKMKRKHIGTQYSPGHACTFCPRQLECEARRDYIRSSAEALQVVGAGAIPTQAALLQLYPRAQMLEKAIKQYRTAMKMYLRETGPVLDSHGNRFGLSETKRTEIDARKAWPVLVAHGFSEDDLAECVEMSHRSIMDCASARAPRGKKKQAKELLRQLLTDRGCITETTSQSISFAKGGR